MRGHFHDLWSEYPAVASQIDQPVNKYIFEFPITMPWLGFYQSDNQGAQLANAREVPFAMANVAQPPQVYLQNQEFGVFDTGGLAVIPFAGIWRAVK